VPKGRSSRRTIGAKENGELEIRRSIAQEYLGKRTSRNRGTKIAEKVIHKRGMSPSLRYPRWRKIDERENHLSHNKDREGMLFLKGET